MVSRQLLFSEILERAGYPVNKVLAELFEEYITQLRTKET
jgi:hypothetical protein